MIIYFNESADLRVYDEVSTTTSEFPYDNYYGNFVSSNELTHYAVVSVEHTHSDYSEYDPRTCRNGGDYGYDFYTVTEIHEVGELGDII